MNLLLPTRLIMNLNNLNALNGNQNIDLRKVPFKTLFESFETLRCEFIASCENFYLQDLNASQAIISPSSSIWCRKRTKDSDQILKHAHDLFLVNRTTIFMTQWQMNFTFLQWSFSHLFIIPLPYHSEINSVCNSIKSIAHQFYVIPLQGLGWPYANCVSPRANSLLMFNCLLIELVSEKESSDH
ncbi:MAG: hypothetical protein QOH41_1762 [Blastocatellia bacterium]|nr:hypothetical protein [Blastocatellia bacterium]